MSYVITSACTACGACLLTCPEHAIVVGLPLQVRADRCSSCGECVEVCPADAVLEVASNSRAPSSADHGIAARRHAAGAGTSSMIGAGGAGAGGVGAGGVGAAPGARS